VRYIILRGGIAGLIAGLVLGLFLKWLEALTGIRVYTLLLNVDYLPFLRFSELGDFLLHMIVSIPLAMILYWLAWKKHWRQPVIGQMLLCSLVVGIFLYPLTLLSERTPALFSLGAILLWLLGHMIYGLVLGLLYPKNCR